MAALRVLVTNTWLDMRAGSELYVRDLTAGLLARGHTPVVYSPVLGEVARELRRATIPVVDDLASLGTPPDVIHGHHHLETLTALLRFPGVPAISVCHGWLPWQEAPPRVPRVRRYVAVDRTCRDRLVLEHGIPEERVRVLLNFVDLERFVPRSPLPMRPARALVFSNAAAETTHLPAVREACAQAGLTLDVVGLRSGRVADAPEALLGSYDVVFAKGRAALEALAVGTAVVLCDALGAGPLVTSADIDRLRGLNFGLRALSSPPTVPHLAAQLARYDAVDAARVSARIRREAGRDAVVDELVEIYDEVIAEQRREGPADPVEEARAAAESLRRVGRIFRETEREHQDHHLRAAAEGDRLRGVAAEAEAEARRHACDAADARADGVRLAAELSAARAEYARAADARAATAADLARTREALDVLTGSTAIRLRDRILAAPGVGALVRAALRAGKRGIAILRPLAPG